MTENVAPLLSEISAYTNQLIEIQEDAIMQDQSFDILLAAAKLRTGFATTWSGMASYLIGLDDRFFNQYEYGMKSTKITYKELRELEEGMDEEERLLFNEIGTRLDGFWKHPDILFEIRGGNDNNLALSQLRDEAIPLLLEINNLTNRMITSQKKLKDHNTALVDSMQVRLKLTTIILATTGIVLGCIVGFFVTRNLVKLLAGLIDELSNGATQIASASEELSASSQSLSQRTTEQASSLEETSSSMEQMASMTSQNADNSKEAAKLASLCNLTAGSGNRSINEMNTAMQDINESSKKIGNIINVIDGIAFQTNLLALNAAAKDTTSLIEDCISKTELGTKLSEKCSEVFNGIVTNVEKVTGLTNEISGASNEQSEGLKQITKTVQEMDYTVQQNAASAEETASASEELAAQSKCLQETVDKLKIEVGVSKQKSAMIDTKGLNNSHAISEASLNSVDSDFTHKSLK